MTRFIAVLFAALFALTACGGSSEDDAKASIKKELLSSDSDFAGTKLTDDEAGCVSDGMVDELGVDKLKEIGLLTEDNKVDTDAQPDDLNAEDADALAGTLVDCVDVQEIMSKEMGSTTDGMSQEQQDCINEAFDDDTVKELISAGFQGKTPESADLQEKVMGCIGS